MRKVVIEYKDKVGCAVGTYQTRPYFPSVAKHIKQSLELMGCFDFKVLPYEKS